MTTPPYLQPGDTIALICPAGFMHPEKWQACADQLSAWGFNVKPGKTMHSASGNYFSGTDEERLADLQAMLNDPTIKAILCGRGGYGLSRIIDQIDFKKFRKHPKWIIGFSDITILHAHINRHLKIATLHGPMANAFNDPAQTQPYLLSLKNALTGKKTKYSTTPHQFNRNGIATGQLIGGNLCLMAHLIGTASAYKTKQKILFLEDVGEYLYNIDRLFIQLKRAGVFDNLAAVIIGGFTDNKDTERPFGKTPEEIISEQLQPYNFPICFNFPVSHGPANYALKIGAEFTLKITPKSVQLKEL
jgi:muramoyltetrapeptide carboxypeptidase